MMDRRIVGKVNHVTDHSEASTGCQIAPGKAPYFFVMRPVGPSADSDPAQFRNNRRPYSFAGSFFLLCLLLVLSGCQFFSRSQSFITYNLPLTVLLRADSSVEQALLNYRDACGQPASVNVEGPLQEALRNKLGMVFQKVVVASSSPVAVDGVVDVALGLKQLELFVPRKANRSYPATMTLGLDFSYSDADGTVRQSKKLQSQTREDVEVTSDSCDIKGLNDLARETVDKVVEGMARHLGDSAKIREAAQSPKNSRPVAAVSSGRPLSEPDTARPDLGNQSLPHAAPALTVNPAAPAMPAERRAGDEARLSFRTIFRDENRNQVLEREERFTVDFEIKNDGSVTANDVEIDFAGHPAVLRNLAHPVKVGTLGPGEIKRMSVNGVLGPVTEVEQAELVCMLRTVSSDAASPAAKRFLIAIRPDREEDAEVLSVDVDQMPYGPGPLKYPQAIGIAIGVGQFRDPAMPGTLFASRDAEVMAKYFKFFMGIPSQRVKLLQDTHVMKDDLAEVFEKWLPEQVEPRSTALVYVSGRAVVDPTTGAVSLVPFDGSAASSSRLFSLARLRRALARTAIQQAVLLLDLSLEPTPGTDAAEASMPTWDTSENGQSSDRLMWIIGNNALQDAHAYRPGQHGLFTYYLFKGLRGAADLDKNGTVLAGELCTYVHRQVQDVAKHQYGNAQEPLCLPNAGQSSRFRVLPLSKPH
jgi:hypothetical protein